MRILPECLCLCPALHTNSQVTLWSWPAHLLMWWAPCVSVTAVGKDIVSFSYTRTDTAFHYEGIMGALKTYGKANLWSTACFLY